MADKRPSRLGTGLSALFGEEKNLLEGDQTRTLPLARLEPRKDQPRRDFDPEALQALADSIREYGLIQPITVRPLDQGYFQIVAGERRWRAARLAGLTEVPVRVIEADDRQATELALVENLQREDLNPMEEASGYQKLMDEFGLTQEQAARRVQRSRPAVANALRLLTLCPPVQRMVAEGRLSAGHARALVVLKDEETQRKAAEETAARGLSVRQTEKLAASLLRGERSRPPDHGGGVDYTREAERRLSEALGRGVRLTGGAKKGRIALEFYSPDDREALMDALLKMEKPWKAKTEE